MTYGYRSRSIFGLSLILFGIVLVVIYNHNHTSKTYKIDEIKDDIINRIYSSADGSNNVQNINIEVTKKVGTYLVYLYSYDYKDTGLSNNYVVYEQHGNKYIRHVGSILSFNFKDSKHNKGLQYIMLDGYVIVAGIVNPSDADIYEIVSGDTKVTERYERSKYFIKEYVLGNPNEVSIKPE